MRRISHKKLYTIFVYLQPLFIYYLTQKCAGKPVLRYFCRYSNLIDNVSHNVHHYFHTSHSFRQ